MVLDADGAIGELEDLGIGEAEAFALGAVGRHIARAGVAMPARIDEP